VIVALHQRINQQLPRVSENIVLGVEDERLSRHLKVGVLEIVSDGP
jgi:hypothetical protein